MIQEMGKIQGLDDNWSQYFKIHHLVLLSTCPPCVLLLQKREINQLFLG